MGGKLIAVIIVVLNWWLEHIFASSVRYYISIVLSALKNGQVLIRLRGINFFMKDFTMNFSFSIIRWMRKVFGFCLHYLLFLNYRFFLLRTMGRLYAARWVLWAFWQHSFSSHFASASTTHIYS